MKLVQIEDSLARWLGSKWTGYAVRAFIIIGVPLLGGMITLGSLGTGNRVATVEAKLVQVTASQGEISKTQLARATDSENFQREVRLAVAGVNSKVDAVDDKVFKVSVDIGVIKRLVTEMRNQDVASADVLTNRHALGSP